MKSTWDWIVANKNWVFDGFGVALVVAVLGFIFKGRSEAKQRQKGGKGSTNVQAGGDVNINGNINKWPK